MKINNSFTEVHKTEAAKAADAVNTTPAAIAKAQDPVSFAAKKTTNVLEMKQQEIMARASEAQPQSSSTYANLMPAKGIAAFEQEISRRAKATQAQPANVYANLQPAKSIEAFEQEISRHAKVAQAAAPVLDEADLPQSNVLRQHLDEQKADTH